MARAPSFQVGYEGSIPFTRSPDREAPPGASRRDGRPFARAIDRKYKRCDAHGIGIGIGIGIELT